MRGSPTLFDDGSDDSNEHRIAVDSVDDDPALNEVVEALRAADPDGARAALVFRRTFDQLYDGQRTGRYKWADLYKTERTHFGTLIEINLRREFKDVIEDGHLLDYSVRGHEVDCKYSQKHGGWMLPPECFGELLLVCTASDEHAEWAMGVVRADEANRRPGVNRDAKSGLSAFGRSHIRWLHFGAELPPNVLLSLDEQTQHQIFSHKSGQSRVNELFRQVQLQRIGRNSVATVAQQDDYMKRVRANGGARTALASEGILVAGGDYASHRRVARQLGIVVPAPGEFVSVRVALADPDDPNTVTLDGVSWRVALPTDPVIPAPSLPRTNGASGAR